MANGENDASCWGRWRTSMERNGTDIKVALCALLLLCGRALM